MSPPTIVAHALPKGCADAGIAGHAVGFSVEFADARPPLRGVLPRSDAEQFRACLSDALRAFGVAETFTAPIPRLRHEEAEAVGCALRDYFAGLGLTLVVEATGVRIGRDDLVWADAVQRVLRVAGETLADREGRG